MASQGGGERMFPANLSAEKICENFETFERSSRRAFQISER